MKPGSLPQASVLFISTALVIYGLYALVEPRLNPQVLGISIALISVAGGIGLMLNRRWSKFCIYLVSAALTGTWIYYVVLLAARAWPYDTVLESVISLVPGVTLILFGAASSYLVMKHFGAKSTKTL